MKRVLLLITIAVVGSGFVPRAHAAQHAPAQPRWAVESSPTAANLTDISCASARECVAVGAGATILRTVNQGQTWTRITTGYGAAHPAAQFASVRCPAPGVCSVLAPANIVLRTADGGKSWQQHTVSLGPQLAGLTRLACPTRKVCFAAAPPSGTPFSWFTHSSAVYKTSNANRVWNPVSIPLWVTCPGDCNERPVGYALQWISCQSALSCYAGGDAFIGSHEGYSSAVIRTKDGGENWALVHQDFDASFATCPTAGICTGIYYQPLTPSVGPEFVRSTDGGLTWIRKPMPHLETAIACAGPSFCELAGPRGALTMAIAGRLFAQLSPTTRDLTAVACPRRDACYAVGAGGTIVARRRYG